jgi:hypothetical protein
MIQNRWLLLLPPNCCHLQYDRSVDLITSVTAATSILLRAGAIKDSDLTVTPARSGPERGEEATINQTRGCVCVAQH